MIYYLRNLSGTFLKIVCFIAVLSCLWTGFLGNVVAGEAEKPCPDPKVQYETWSGEDYWALTISEEILEGVWGDKFFCATFNFMTVDSGIFTRYLLVSLSDMNDREQKEKGLVEGVKSLIEERRIYFEAMDEDALMHYELMGNGVFGKKQIVRLEKVFGVKKSNSKEWFDWLDKNKDSFTLSKNGKGLVAKKN